MNTLSNSLAVIVCTTSLLLITGCDKVKELSGDKDEKEAPYKTSVNYPKTAPLEPGISISRSLAISQSQATQQQSAVELTPVDSTSAKNNATSINNTTQNSKKDTIVLNTAIEAGTPIATLKKAMDIIYTGDAKQAVAYYHTDQDITEALIQTQIAFRKGIASVKYTNTKYSKNKTEAQVTSEIVEKNTNKVRTIELYLKKIKGEWKILVQ